MRADRLAEYRQNPAMPFFLWLRYLTGQRLLEQHRRHLGAQGRDAGREISLYRGAMPETTTAALAAQLLGRHTSPSQAAQRAERKIRLQEALNSLDPIDREILALRHFEQLSNGEAAQVLGLDKSAASKRYARALIRLKDILASHARGPWRTLNRPDSLEGASTMADEAPRRPRPSTATRSSGWPTRSSPDSAPASGRASRSTPPSTPSWPTRSASCCRPWSSWS